MELWPLKMFNFGTFGFWPTHIYSAISSLRNTWFNYWDDIGKVNTWAFHWYENKFTELTTFSKNSQINKVSKLFVRSWVRLRVLINITLIFSCLHYNMALLGVISQNYLCPLSMKNQSICYLLKMSGGLLASI